jgi:hypothetical protein
VRQKTIERLKFDSIVKIMVKRKDSLRLIKLALNVCHDKVKIFTVKEDSEIEQEGTVSMNERLTLI